MSQDRERKVGWVDRVLRERAFGFIKTDNGDEFFLHRSNCTPNLLFDELEAGDAVIFTPTPSPKGFKAMSVSRAPQQDAQRIAAARENAGNR